MSATEFAPARRVRFSLLDREASPLAGVILRIFVDGVLLGQLQSGDGEASIALEGPDREATLDVFATFAGQKATARLGPHDDHHRFTFDAVGLVRSKAPAQARCPDGTSGSPCITCRSGDRVWRICA